MSQNPNSNNLYSSCPLSKPSFKNKKDKLIDEQQLYNRFNLILVTFREQKQQYQQTFRQQKQQLNNRIIILQQLLSQTQQKYQKLQLQFRQVQFNYHQRGSVIDFLKKKILLIQKKFNNQKDQMISIIKYLEIKNKKLNQENDQIKKKQMQYERKIKIMDEEIKKKEKQWESERTDIEWNYYSDNKINIYTHRNKNNNYNNYINLSDLTTNHHHHHNNKNSNNNYLIAQNHQNQTYLSQHQHNNSIHSNRAKSYNNLQNEIEMLTPTILFPSNSKLTDKKSCKKQKIMNNQNNRHSISKKNLSSIVSPIENKNKNQFSNILQFDQILTKNQSLTQSTIKQKTVILQHNNNYNNYKNNNQQFNRSKSYNDLDFSNINVMSRKCFIGNSNLMLNSISNGLNIDDFNQFSYVGEDTLSHHYHHYNKKHNHYNHNNKHNNNNNNKHDYQKQILINNYGHLILGQYTPHIPHTVLKNKSNILKKINSSKSKASIKISNLYCDVFK